MATPALTANPAPTASPADTAPPQPIIHFAVEDPFRLDRRIFPSTKEAFLADLKDRTAWNQGGLGELTSPLPPVPGHPAPKVIIDVTRASGAIRAADAQRVLRKGLWIKVVECFSLAAYKDQKLRGAVKLAATVSATGKVSSARATQHNFPDDEVPRCLGNQLRAFAMPKAKGRTTLALEIQIGHGDEPVPPPASLIVAGDGELTPEQVRTAIEGAQPEFEGCYRAALAYAPELWGRMGIRFHVTEKGKTDEAFEVESRFPDERVSLCVLRAARQIVFPKPVGGDLRFIVPLRLWSERSPIPAAPNVRRP
ncbi:MAG: AgmX/PglI C-terminal domain-containing protein [Minicystis sp.]